MSNAILLTNSLSPHGNNVVILLAAAGLLEKVEIKQIDLMKGEHKTPEFLAVNPTGQIAALKDGDVSVYESDAIIRYLAIKYKSPFFPVNDLAKLAAVDSVHTHVRQKVWDNATGLVFHRKFKKMMMGVDGDPAVIAAKEEGLDKSLAFVNSNYFKDGSVYLVNGEFSTADVVLLTAVAHAVKHADYKIKGDKIQAFYDHMAKQDWFKKTPYGQ